MRYEEYVILRPSGEVEKARVPSFFDVFDVSKRLAHSVVFLKVPKGHGIFVRNRDGAIQGPTYVLVDRATENLYAVSGEVRTEHECYAAWKTVRAEGFQIA